MVHLSVKAENSKVWTEILAELMFGLIICQVKLRGTGFGRDCSKGPVPRILTRIINLPRAPDSSRRLIYYIR